MRISTEWRWKKSRAAAAGRMRRRRLAVEHLEERCCLAAVVMSNHEQLLLELINRARANPTSESALYGIDLNQGLPPGTITPVPKQPLAPHQALSNAAGAHSQDMLDRDYFAHNNPEGKTPFDRMLAAGYTNAIGVLENISWGGTTGPLDQNVSVLQRHESLFKSPSHRTNILRTSAREVGAGVRFGVFTDNGVNFNAGMVTEDFGARPGDPFLTGVVFTDSIVRDQFYSLGEGLGNVTVTAVHATAGTTFTTQSGPSGGYVLQVPAGLYTVRAEGGALGGVIIVSNVVVAAENRKVDFEASTRVALPPTISDIANLTTNEDTTTATISFSVASSVFADTQLAVSAASSNPALVPAGNVTLGGSGASRTLTVAPAANQFGVATITVTVADPGGLTASDSFLLTVLPVNDPPTITPISDQFIVKNGNRLVTVVVQDIDTPAEQLTVTAASTNGALLPPTGMAIFGIGTARTLSLLPTSGQEGTAAITVRVSDGQLESSTLFTAWVLEDPFPWHNEVRPLDVDLSGQAGPLDALLIINYLNAGFPTKILPTAASGGGPGFLDTSGDNEIAPLDALLVINALNARVAGGEGEGRGEDGAEVLLSLLAADAVELAAKRRRGS